MTWSFNLSNPKNDKEVIVSSRDINVGHLFSMEMIFLYPSV